MDCASNALVDSWIESLLASVATDCRSFSSTGCFFLNGVNFYTVNQTFLPGQLKKDTLYIQWTLDNFEKEKKCQISLLDLILTGAASSWWSD